MKKAHGFTLVELVTVIVLLGVLAAVAAPKFINLTSDAEKAVFVSMAGAFESNLSVVKAKYLVSGSPNSPIVINGQTVHFKDGWPRTENISDCNVLWLAMLEQPDEYHISTVNIDLATYNGWVVSHFKSDDNKFLFCQYYYTKNSKIVGEPSVKFIYSDVNNDPVEQGVTIVDNLFN